MSEANVLARRAWWIGLGALTLGVGVFLHTLFYSDGWRNRARAQADLSALRQRNDATEAEVQRLRGDIDAMRTRPEAQERAVRHHLGWVKPDDVVLELGEK